jgi:capsular exopolysaccharide synthesis family protein
MYQPEHPSLQRAESMMRATEAERGDKIKEILRMRLEGTLKQLGDERDSLRTTLERLEQEEEAKMIQLRDLTASHTVYESMATQREYLEQHRDADLQLIKEVQLMQLRDDARRVGLAQQALQPRERAFPKLELVVPMSALLVVSLTVGLIFLREFTDQRVRSASDLSVVPGAQVVGVIPDRSEDPTRPKAAELVVRRHSNSVLAESYRQAFAMVSKAVHRAGHQALLLVGGLPGAGSTTAATNLAATWAAAGRRVVLVDANFRRPALAEALGAEANGAGLGDVLAGAATVADVIVNVSPNLNLIAAGTPANRVFELLNTRQFDSMMAQLRDEYDIILFDAPPAVVAGEAMALASKVDAALLVVRAGQEQRGLVARLINQLADAHCELIGILLNRPRGTAGGYFRKNFATMASYNAERD